MPVIHSAAPQSAGLSLALPSGLVLRGIAGDNLPLVYRLLSEAVPLRLLDGFEGVLQVDGYGGYNRVCRDNPIARIGCWDHARRRFVEASKAAPAKKKDSKISKADVAICKIRKLYDIEDRSKDLEPEHKESATAETEPTGTG